MPWRTSSTIIGSGRLIRSTFGKSVLLCGCVVAIVTSGCITVTPPTSLSKIGKKSKVSQVSYEEEIPQTTPDPENPEELKLAYARWMEEMNQVVEARKHYSSVAEVEPENVQAILGLARIDQVSGQFAEAEQKFKRALKLDPRSAEAQLGLGQFYASQKRWTESIEHLSASLLADPENTSSRYQLAVALVHAGDVDSALPHFIRTVGDAEGHFNTGLILHEEQRFDEAEKHFLLATSKKPDFQKAEQWLARIKQERDTFGSLPQSARTHIVPVVGTSQQAGHTSLR